MQANREVESKAKSCSSREHYERRQELRTTSKGRCSTYNGTSIIDEGVIPTTSNNRSTSECNQYNSIDTEELLPLKRSNDGLHVVGCGRKTSKHLHRSRSLTELKYRRANVVGLVGSLKSTSTARRSTADLNALDDDQQQRRRRLQQVRSPFGDDIDDCCWSTEMPVDTVSPQETSKTTGFGSYKREQKYTLICLALIHFGVYLSMSIIAPFFPIEAQSKGMSLSVTGWIFSSYALVMFLVSPFMGKIIAAFGVKFTLISGLFVASGCNILFGSLNFVNETTLFTTLCFVLRSIEAIGATAFFTAAWTIIAETFPDDISYVFGIMETFVGIGMTAGPAIGGALYSAGGYELPFYSLGAFMMATVPVCMYILPDPQIKNELDDEQSSIRSLIRLFKLPGMITVCLAVMVLCGIWGFLDPTLEPHLRDFGVTPQSAGLLFLFMAATYSITCPIVGRISDKWNCEMTMMFLGLVSTAVCLVMMGPSIVLPFIPSELRWNVLSLILLGITIGTGTIPTFQLMLDEAYKGGFEESPATYGMVSSIFAAASSLGEFIGPAVGGVLFEYYSFDMACTCIGIASVATAAILVLSTMISSCKLSDVGGDAASWSVRSLRRWKGNSNESNITNLSDSGVFDSNERTPLLTNKV